jgi:pilus assembly protein CpaE
VLLVVLAGWQLMLAGQASWLAGNAARVAARAEAVGGDAEQAARSALPRHLRHDLDVVRRDGDVTVRVRLPIVMRGWGSPIRVGATAGAPR